MNEPVQHDERPPGTAGTAGGETTASRLSEAGRSVVGRSQDKLLGASSRMTRVSRRIAKSMLGRAVSLRMSTGETVHGIVTSVLLQGAKPRVVVGGFEYELGQILTVAPPNLPGSRTEA